MRIQHAIVCTHTPDCRCDDCIDEMARWHEWERQLAADPERETAAVNFAAWVESDPEPWGEERAA